MAESDRNQSEIATDEPSQTRSKAGRIKKYTFILAFAFGGSMLWITFIQGSEPLSLLQWVEQFGAFALIGILLWYRKLGLFEIVVTALVLPIGIMLIFLSFVGLPASYNVIGLWAIDPIPILAFFVISIVAILAIYINC
ncbi:hypothetical protein [Pseudovibrio sp. Ad26]|uniref:hypothetical protein n=1 Tax=Pseudovibrio sp. Ad26 TaxID=989410 RepID=UPI0007AEA004|nr:hypothetical protein [Pseudovibrio sp. Ad26]KZL06008.1 hypothetical protein PsAD26_04155 [Pseudovibrio sp. Ad26]